MTAKKGIIPTSRYFKDRRLGPFYSQPRKLHYLVRVDPDDTVWLEYADGVELRHESMKLQEVMHNYQGTRQWSLAELQELERRRG